MLTWRIRVNFSRERTFELVVNDEQALGGISGMEANYSREKQRSENAKFSWKEKSHSPLW